MPNNILSQGQQVLEALIGLGKVHYGSMYEGAKSYGEYASKPIEILGSLLGELSNQPQRNQLKQSIKGTRTEQSIQSGQQQDPLTPYMAQVAEKTVKKQLEADSQEVLQQPDGLNILASIANQGQEQNGTEQQQDLGQALAGQPQTQQEQPVQQANQENEPKEMGLLKRLLIGFAEGFTSGAAPDLYTQRLQRQRILGQEPLQEGDRERIGLETDRAIKIQSMNDLFSGKISDREKQLQTQQSFESDLESLVSAWDGLGMGKGGLGGRLGGLSAGTIGQVFGTGREARAKFESVSNGVLYSAGAYILGQTGRALVEADLKRLEKMAKFTPSMKREDFKGKMQAILDFANSKVAASGGEIKYKTADDLMNSIRNTKKQSVGQVTPEVGIVEDGYRFKGGNPSDPNSWEKI